MKFQLQHTNGRHRSGFFVAMNYFQFFRLGFFILAIFYGSFSCAYSSKAPTLRIEVGQHTGMINRLAINQTASLLATASDDKTLRLWNLPEGTAYATLRVPIGENLQGALYAVALSPDGKTVIAAGETGNATDKFSIYVFDVDKRILKARIPDLPSAVYHLAYSKNGQYFAAAFAGGYGIKIWDSQNGQLIAEDTDYSERSTWLEFNNAGQLITVSHDGFIRQYNQQFIRIKKSALHKQGLPYSVKISPDQKHLAIGYSNLPLVDVLDSQLNTLQTLEIKALNAQNSAIVAWQINFENQPGLYVSGTMQNQQGKYIVRHWPDIDQPLYYQDIPVSKNIVTDLISLPDAANNSVDTLFATAEPSWGGLKNNQLVYKNQADLWDARIVELPQKTFHLSQDGFKIAYALDAQSNQYNIFDINTLNLKTHNTPAALSDLHPPITQHAQVKISNWQRGDAPLINGKSVNLDPYEKSLALAIDPGAAHALIGSNYHLRLLDFQGKELKKITVPAEVYGLNIAENGKLVVAALGDGTLRWYSLQASELLEELVAFFPYHQGNAWIIWTKEGFFANSDAGGHQLAGYQLNKGDNKRPEWLSFTQLYQAYYAPDLIVPKLLRQESLIQERTKTIENINNRLSNHPVPVIKLVDYCINPQLLATRAFTREKPPLTDHQPSSENITAKIKTFLLPFKTWVLAKLNKPAPTSTVPVIAQAPSEPVCYSLAGQGNTRAFSRQSNTVSPITSAAIYRNQFDQLIPSIKLRYAVQSREGGIGDIDVYVNNQIQQTHKELHPESALANQQEYTQDITLKAGENRIVINAYEKSGGSSAQSALIELLNPVASNFVAESQEKPRIIILSVGINAYPQPNQLQYAVKDASDFLDTVSQYKSDSYAEVVKFSLMDNQATLSNIEATFDKIAGLVNKNDTVLIYLSGHGLKEGMNYYFIPQDVDDNNLATTALSQHKLKANMAKLAKTDHIFMFIDSCHSGAVDLAKIDQDISSFDKIKQQLGDNIFILAASGENQEAQDQFRLENSDPADNGLFAYAVMEGLKGKARRLDDNIIDNYNLGSYVQRRVNSLTKNQSLYKQKARFQMVEVGDVLTFDITKYH